MKNNYPTIVCWRITSECNRNCPFCFRPDRQNLSTKEIYKIIDNLAECGVKGIGITGGEPLLRKDIIKILKYIWEKNIRICLATNADFYSKYQKSINKYVATIGIPIEGSTREIHESLRGINNFHNIINTIDKVYNRKLNRVKFGMMNNDMLTLSGLKKELKVKANPKKAKVLQRFFKTGPGEYGQGDIFLGVAVPLTRKIAKKYNILKLTEAAKLLRSKIHEERLAALLMMVDRFRLGQEKEIIYKTYLKNAKYINNWDLVDLSADKIVGDYLFNKPKGILYKLAKSKSVWQRRIAVMATFNFIKKNRFEDTFKIAEILLRDKHDLIHKAVGWMLREVGKKDFKAEEGFLDKYHKKMARTSLRYAIEKFPEKKRKEYLFS